MADTAPRGSLVVVGTGIRPPLHTTTEAIRRIERADRVPYLLAEQAPSRWIHERNPSARSLAHLYAEHEHRADVYEAMVEEVLAPVREGLGVCFALYGHPGVFVSPSQEAIEASPFPVGPSHVERVRLGDLPDADVTPMSTLYVPPARTSPLSAAMMERLGITKP